MNMSNAINIIEPYKLPIGLYAFDDEARGLQKEPFVESATYAIDKMRDDCEISKDFAIIFSDNEFPGWRYELNLQEPEFGGNWYTLEHSDYDQPLKAWLCPALLKYFDTPPSNIFVRLINKR